MTGTVSKKSLVWFAVYLLMFAAIALFLLKPTLSDITQNKRTIIQQQKQLASNDDEIVSLQKITKDKTGFDEIKKIVFGYLPEVLDSSQFIVEVEGLAKKTDITISSVSMNASPSAVGGSTTKSSDSESDTKTATTAKAKGGTQKNQFSLSTKADFSRVMSFIAQMEKLSRFNSITSISIASVEDGGADVKLTGDIFYEQ